MLHARDALLEHSQSFFDWAAWATRASWTFDDGFFWLAGSLGILRVSPQELEKALQSSSYRMQGMSLDAADGLAQAAARAARW